MRIGIDCSCLAKEERTGVALPPGKYETVAGYVLATLDRMLDGVLAEHPHGT